MKTRTTRSGPSNVPHPRRLGVPHCRRRLEPQKIFHTQTINRPPPQVEIVETVQEYLLVSTLTGRDGCLSPFFTHKPQSPHHHSLTVPFDVPQKVITSMWLVLSSTIKARTLGAFHPFSRGFCLRQQKIITEVF